MQVQFELTIGNNKFTLIETVDSHTDFFKKLNFYSTLPKVGPNGETDLVLRHRLATTKDRKKVDYYSIVSEKAKAEFKFGQSQTVNGGLFPKGWEPLFNAEGSDEDSQGNEEQAIAPGTSVGLGAPVAQAPAQSAGLGVSQPAAKPAQAVKPAAAPVTNGAAPTQVQNQAKSVLSKFGI